jgi:hypothetical protein
VTYVTKYSVSILWCLGARQLYRIDILHPPRHSATAATLRDTIKYIDGLFVLNVFVCLFTEPVSCSDSVASSYGITGVIINCIGPIGT